jgi:hypothetical protein
MILVGQARYLREAMDSTISRKFRLSDALVLIAATAIGLLQIRYAKDLFGIRDMFGIYHDDPAPWYTDWKEAILWRGVMATLVPCALMWSLSILSVLLLRGPLERRFFSQPGMLSFVTTALVFTVVTSNTILASEWRDPNRSISRMIYFNINFPISEMNGLAIGAVWLARGISGRWRRSSDGYELSGRILGIFWIAVSVMRFWIEPVCKLLGCG